MVRKRKVGNRVVAGLFLGVATLVMLGSSPLTRNVARGTTGAPPPITTTTNTDGSTGSSGSGALNRSNESSRGVRKAPATTKIS